MSSSGSPLAVRVRAVEKRFARLRVLCGLDLEVGRGESVAVFGPNGAGKTTLLRIVAGLLRVDGGSVLLFGEQGPANPRLRRRIGMVAHDNGLYGDLSASENLKFYARLYGVSVEPGKLLDRVALAGVTDRPVRKFSRGMLQRLALARAILHDPDLLLLDEPFTGLDPDGADLLAAILDDLQARNKTIVLTTHDFQRGLAVAGRAVLIHGGRLAWTSGPALPNARRMAELYAELTHAGGPAAAGEKQR